MSPGALEDCFLLMGDTLCLLSVTHLLISFSLISLGRMGVRSDMGHACSAAALSQLGLLMPFLRTNALAYCVIFIEGGRV